MYGDCHCLQEIDSEDEDEDEDDGYSTDSDLGEDELNGQAQRKKFAYHSRGLKAGLLRGRILGSKQPIYECHAECGCSISCPNRVVERGRQVPLQIFRTDNRGWGEACHTNALQRALLMNR